MRPYGRISIMGYRKSTRLHLDNEIVETAKQTGLNTSRVIKNALIEAIERLGGPKLGAGLTGLVRPPGFGPGLSAREAEVLTRLSDQRSHALISRLRPRI